MLSFLRNLIPERHPLRLLYHKFLAMLAALIHGFPANRMIVVGVTGTNGKTTTINLITNILNTAGYKVGMASTINFQIGERKWVNDTKQTTLGPFFVQKLLKQMYKAGCRYAVLEVTSHAIDQSRILESILISLLSPIFHLSMWSITVVLIITSIRRRNFSERFPGAARNLAFPRCL